MGDRAERRRQARAAAKGQITGFVTSLGEVIDTNDGVGQLPDKVPGQHRWIATVGYTMTQAMAARWLSGDDSLIMDRETLFVAGVGCYDCEISLSPVNPRVLTSRCPAPASP